MPSYSPVPDVPMEGLNLAESGLFRALKENVEILSGARISGVRAITNDTVTVTPSDVQQLKRITSTGDGVNYPGTVSNTTIISFSDYQLLRSDVQNIANDLARLQNVVNSLLQQLRS